MALMQFRARLAGSIAAVLLLAACGSSNNQASPAADSSPTPSSTTSTTIIDATSRTIQAHPDAAYINAVLVDLQHVIGDVRRDVYMNQTMSQATYDRIDDVYAGGQVSYMANIFSKASEIEHPTAVPVPGDEKVSVDSILDAKPTCLVVKVDDDWKAILKTPATPEQWVFELDYSQINNRSNPTPWKISFETEYKQDLLDTYTCENLQSQSA